MINFRYHVVSLVAVFLALAVGIVLGAGPLKGTIGDTLNSQVTQLRSEKDALRSDLDQAQQGESYRDTVIESLLPQELSGLLPGERVAIVVAGDGAGDLVSALQDAVSDAGGTVSGRVTVTSKWLEGQGSDLVAAAGALPSAAAGAGILVPSESPSASASPESSASASASAEAARASDSLASALVDALAGGDSGAAGAAAPADVLASLKSSNMVDAGQVASDAQEILVVVGSKLARPVTDSGPLDSSTKAQRAAENRAVESVVRATGDVGAGTVVLGPADSAQDIVSLIRADDDLSGEVSTVDGPSTPLAVLLTARALAAEASGQHGAYGVDGMAQGGAALPSYVPVGPGDGSGSAAPSGAGSGQ